MFRVEQYAIWEDEGTNTGKRREELGLVSGPMGDSGPEKVKDTNLTGKENVKWAVCVGEYFVAYMVIGGSWDSAIGIVTGYGLDD
jgi:hypothetical protein